MAINDAHKYDGIQLNKAFRAAHAGMVYRSKAPSSLYQEEHLKEAQEFIERHPLFADFNANKYMSADIIKRNIKAFHESKPHTKLRDFQTISLIEMWVTRYTEEINKFDEKAREQAIKSGEIEAWKRFVPDKEPALAA